MDETSRHLQLGDHRLVCFLEWTKKTFQTPSKMVGAVGSGAQFLILALLSVLLRCCNNYFVIRDL